MCCATRQSQVPEQKTDQPLTLRVDVALQAVFATIHTGNNFVNGKFR
jgi:hypothetical protein